MLLAPPHRPVLTVGYRTGGPARALLNLTTRTRAFRLRQFRMECLVTLAGPGRFTPHWKPSPWSRLQDRTLPTPSPQTQLEACLAFFKNTPLTSPSRYHPYPYQISTSPNRNSVRKHPTEEQNPPPTHPTQQRPPQERHQSRAYRPRPPPYPHPLLIPRPPAPRPAEPAIRARLSAQQPAASSAPPRSPNRASPPSTGGRGPTTTWWSSSTGTGCTRGSRRCWRCCLRGSLLTRKVRGTRTGMDKEGEEGEVKRWWWLWLWEAGLVLPAGMGVEVGREGVGRRTGG